MAKKKVAKKKALTMEQREKLLLTPCKTRSELKNWIKFHLKMDIPDCTVSRYSNTNPLDAIWQIYDVCVNGTDNEKIEELLYVASRGSGKTLGVAIAELLIMLHDQRDVVHVGAILSQAKRCYDYQVSFMLNDQLRPVLNFKERPDGSILEKANMEKSIFNLKDRYTGTSIKTSLEVLPCTLKAVNGPHVPLVVVDEIDTVQGDGMKAFKDISGMLDSKGKRRALRVGISTRKSRYGLMNKQIEDAEKANRTVKMWTAMEFAERCPDERSGTTPTKAFVLQDDMEVITEAVWAKKEKSKKAEYFLNEFPGEKCLSCPLAALCLGDAKNQKCTSDMLKPITDPIKKSLENGPDWAISQLFNLKPSVEGVIYKEFSEKAHVKKWNDMWRILTNQEYPGECTHDIFVKKCHQMKLSCYAGIDWGWSNPSTIVYFFVDNRENVYVVRCEGRTYTNNPSWVQTIKTKWHNMYRCQLYFPDLANPGDGLTMRQEGLPCPATVEKNVDSGIQVVKKFLRSLASPLPKMYFAEETCGPILKEFGLYHFKTDAAGVVTEDPAKEHDHWLDALRYALYGLFGKTVLISASDEEGYDIGSIVDKATGGYTRTPSAEEFAHQQGLQLETEVDTSRLGELGTASSLDDDDDDINGSSGFLWSF